MSNDISSYIPKLNNLAQKICGDIHLAEEAVSDTLLEALEGNIHDFNEIETICRKISSKYFNGSKHAKEILVSTVTDDEYEGSGLNWDVVDIISYKNNPLEEESENLSIIDQMLRLKKEGSYLSFEEARMLIRQLNLKNLEDYKKWWEKNKKYVQNIVPKYFRHYYGKHKKFTTIADFLGNESYYSYEQAKTWVQTNFIPKGINTPKKFEENKHLLPEYIPITVKIFYSKQGIDFKWDDFFGIKQKRPPLGKRLTLEEFKKYVQDILIPQGIDTCTKYEKNYNNLPSTLPARPDKHYKISWPEIFNKEKIISKDYWDIDKVKQWIQENLVPLNINTWTKFEEYTKNKYPNAPLLPINIPKCLYFRYGKKGVRYIFENDGLNSRKYWSLQKIKNWIIVYLEGKVKSKTDWQMYIKGEIPNLPPLNKNIPENITKLREWTSWKDFFEEEQKERRDAKRKRVEILSYQNAKKYVQNNLVSKGICTVHYWEKRIKEIPLFLPADPREYYLNRGWISDDDFFGEVGKKMKKKMDVQSKKLRYINAKKRWRSLGEIKKWVFKNLMPYGINTERKYYDYLKGKYPLAPPLPKDIPRSFDRVFKNEWKGKGWRYIFKEENSFKDISIVKQTEIHINGNMSGKKLQKLLKPKK